MSAPQRRQQQPHQYQQQYYQPQQEHAAQQFAHDPSYPSYPTTSYHPQQQQLYQHSQPYPSADPYAFTQNAQPLAQSTAQLQITPYEGSWPRQHYVSPTGASNLDPAHAAYPQAGGYLTAADYAATPVDFSSNQMQPASRPHAYEGYSHGQSAGRSRLNNFALPSQGASPSLESQVAHMNISGPNNALPNKSIAHQHNNAQTHSGIVYSSKNADLAAGAGETCSEISLRYPPLPTLPERCATPTLLQSKRSTLDDGNSSQDVDSAVLAYVTSLRTILSTYEKRDDLLRLRTEAVGFQPRQAWSAWQSEQDSSTADTLSSADDSVSTNPVLGVRLLQRLDRLQRENDELGRLLTTRARVESGSGGDGAVETERLRSEIRDCHRLIQAMDKALMDAEARATASERALQIACMNHSTAMVPAPNGEAPVTAAANVKSGSSEEKRSTAVTTSRGTAPVKRGSKQPNLNASASGKSGASQQQQHRTTNKPQNTTAPATKAGGGAKSTRGDKKSSTASTDAKPSKSVKSK